MNCMLAYFPDGSNINRIFAEPWEANIQPGVDHFVFLMFIVLCHHQILSFAPLTCFDCDENQRDCFSCLMWGSIVISFSRSSVSVSTLCVCVSYIVYSALHDAAWLVPRLQKRWNSIFLKFEARGRGLQTVKLNVRLVGAELNLSRANTGRDMQSALCNPSIWLSFLFKMCGSLQLSTVKTKERTLCFCRSSQQSKDFQY